MTSLHEQLLRKLAPGAVMWLPASGNSLWPLLRDGDTLRVTRVAEAGLRRGDVAVVKLPSGVLAAHLVVSLAPLTTASSVGVVDAGPLEALARVTGFRRGGVEHGWPRTSQLALQFLPGTARWLKRVPGLRALVHALRER